MKIRLMFGMAFTLVLSSCHHYLPQVEPKPVYPVPNQRQLAWHDMEMYAFIHFSINTFTDKEWGYGDERPELFNPSEFNAEQWAVELKNAGMQGIILTAKHHDGFCLWPSKFTEHSVKNSPYKNGNGDIVREVVEACRKYNLKVGIYLSPWDRNHPDYGTEAYIQYYRNQLKELVMEYGPFFEIWLDGANGGDGWYGGRDTTITIDGRTYYDWPITISLIRSLMPNVLFFSDAGPDIRWVGNENGRIGETNWNFLSIDTLYAGQAGINELLYTGSEDGKKWVGAEADVSIRPGWFYHPGENSKVKSAEELFDIYLTSVGRGGNLLLNIPPDRRGLLHEADVEQLRAFGALLKSRFSNNLAKRAKMYIPGMEKGRIDIKTVTDGDRSTYWAAQEASSVVELQLNKKQPIHYISLMENIALGQRVRAFEIEAMIDGRWTRIGVGTTIGHKRILSINPVSTDLIRIHFMECRAPVVLAEIGVY